MNKRIMLNIDKNIYNDLSDYLNFDSVEVFNDIEINEKVNKDTTINLIMVKDDINNSKKCIRMHLGINEHTPNTHYIRYIEDFYKIFKIRYNDFDYGLSFNPNIYIEDYYYMKHKSLNVNKEDYEYLKSIIYLNNWSIFEDLIDYCYVLLCSNFIDNVLIDALSGYKHTLINKCLYFGANYYIDTNDIMSKKYESIDDIKLTMVSLLLEKLNNKSREEESLFKNIANILYVEYRQLMTRKYH